MDLARSPYLDDTTPDAFARAEALPIRSGSIDTVLGLSMLTCLPEPLLMLEEAHRVLKPGGILLLEFTQMVPLHDEPHDYFRFTRYGAAWLLGARRLRADQSSFPSAGWLGPRRSDRDQRRLNRINRGPLRAQ
mgnify:CR=1 FL=1